VVTLNDGRDVGLSVVRADPRSLEDASGSHHGVLTDLLAHAQLEVVPIRSLHLSGTPRLSGESVEHIRTLAESESELPPILVQRNTMRVIDGMHRLRAAQLNGEEVIAVRFFECGEDMAFVAAVEANIAHGLPLPLADREAAAGRILADFPHWSDRAVATSTGLSNKTVSAIRRRSANANRPGVRIGRDGRARPVDGAEGRRRVLQAIDERPEASLRDIARTAGVSPTTARDVRERLRRGEHPIPPRQRPEQQPANVAMPEKTQRSDRQRRPLSAEDRAAIMQVVKNDPSLRLTETGRLFLRWLGTRALSADEWQTFVAAIPAHATYIVSDLARACAAEWSDFADQLTRRTDGSAVRSR
jgi:ParB-like chromosome segregation protein Spo0J